jgi:hypothetical protein
MIESPWHIPGLRAFCSERSDPGCSEGSFQRCNYGLHSGDQAEHVERNRQWLSEHLKAPVQWLKQVHGTRVWNVEGIARHSRSEAAPPTDAKDVLAGLSPREAEVLRTHFGIERVSDHTLEEVGKRFDVTRERIRQIEAKALGKLRRKSSEHAAEADASITGDVGCALAVLSADCLPVVWIDQRARAVAVAHAGWRGLCDGVLEAVLARWAHPIDELRIWLGPAISAAHFEVGPEVRERFLAHQPEAEACFVSGRGDRFMADLYGLARLRLQRLGINAAAIAGGEFCTYGEPERFYSFRRDGRHSGRMATVVMLEESF